MAYSADTRKMVLKFLTDGNSYTETSKALGVSISAIKSWERLQRETGGLENRPRERTTTKFHGGELLDFITKNPDATLEAISTNFGGSITGAFNALKREKITFKKEAFFQGTQ